MPYIQDLSDSVVINKLRLLNIMLRYCKYCYSMQARVITFSNIVK